MFTDDESRGSNLTRLLLVENEGDKSQMSQALRGDLAKEIVNAIFDQVRASRVNLVIGCVNVEYEIALDQE